MDSIRAVKRSRFDELVGSRAQLYYALSSEIGGVVEKQSKLFSNALSEHLKFAIDLLDSPLSNIDNLESATSPLKDSIEIAQGIKESGCKRSFDSHLAAISEGIPSLFCICQEVLPPQDFIKDFIDTSTFHLDRIIRANKTSNDIHYRWARAVKDMFLGLLEYSKDCSNPKSELPGTMDRGKNAGGSDGTEREEKIVDPQTVSSSPLKIANLFNQLKSIGSASEVLKKHSGGARNGSPTTAKFSNAPKPVKRDNSIQSSSIQSGSVQSSRKQNVIDGNRWIIEGFSGASFDLDSAKINHTICILDCSNCTVSVDNKVNSIVIDNCGSMSLKMGNIVSQVELSNSHSCKLYLQGIVPTVGVDKCEAIEIYLSEPSLSVEVYTSRSSVVNLMLPSEDGDYIEKNIPQQFKSIVKNGSIITEGVKHVGA